VGPDLRRRSQSHDGLRELVRRRLRAQRVHDGRSIDERLLDLRRGDLRRRRLLLHDRLGQLLRDRRAKFELMLVLRG
jgi:hypothetical protein